MWRSRLLVALLLLAPAAGAASPDYGLTLSPSVDVSDRTVTLGSSSYPVSAVGVVDPGEPVTATVDAAGRDFRLVAYDTHRRRYAAVRGRDDETVRLDTTGWRPGSYLVSLEVAGDVKAVHPLVVNMYRIDVDVPDRPEPGSRVRVRATLTAIDAGRSAIDVTAVVGSADGERSVPLTGTASGAYAGSISLPRDDDAVLAVVVRGTRSALGEREILAVSEPRPLYADEEPTATAAGDAGPVETATADGGATETATAPAVITPAPSTATGELAGLTGGMLVPVVVLAVVLLLLLGFRWR